MFPARRRAGPGTAHIMYPGYGLRIPLMAAGQ